MDNHGRPIAERIAWLFDLARQHSESFCSAASWLERQHYQARHPTAIAVLKCMDGRINIPVATDTPSGVMMPFRNLGGLFDLGWPHLGEVLANYVYRKVGEGRRVILVLTYHFSKGSPSRGCAGFDFDTDAAIRHVMGLKAQVEQVFGGGGTVYPLVCGFETDEDALIVHGAGSLTLDLAEISGGEDLDQRLAALLPDLPDPMRQDLLPMLKGNLRHVARLRDASQARQLDLEHREWMICLGRGFDFLHTPNTALIIGPYSPNLATPICRAAGIIENNMRKGRIPSDGFLLLASVPYEEIGVDRARAVQKSRFLSRYAAEVIGREFPRLAEVMTVHTAVLDWRSRALESPV